jgi:hypothetical protein
MTLRPRDSVSCSSSGSWRTAWEAGPASATRSPWSRFRGAAATGWRLLGRGAGADSSDSWASSSSRARARWASSWSSGPSGRGPDRPATGEVAALTAASGDRATGKAAGPPASEATSPTRRPTVSPYLTSPCEEMRPSGR